MRTPLTTSILAVTLGLVLAACGGTDDVDTAATEAAAESPGETSTMMDDMSPSEDMTMDDMASEDMASEDMGGMGMGGGYGEPAAPSEADRTIEVNVDNDLAFEPDTFTAAPGEVITFAVTNTGDVEHEFVLGDEEAQNAMAEEMAEGGDHAHSGEMSNALTVHAGDTGEITWRFPEESDVVLIGCHVPGHWEAGMRGSVTVE